MDEERHTKGKCNGAGIGVKLLKFQGASESQRQLDSMAAAPPHQTQGGELDSI